MSLLVAILWGGNIGALYPVFEVSFAGKSLSDWADDEITKSRAEIDRIEGLINEVKKNAISHHPSTSPDISLAGYDSLDQAILRLDSEKESVSRLKQIKPYLDHLPSSPFHTVLLIIGVVMFATILKNSCVMLNTLLLARLTNRISLDLQEQFFTHTMYLDQASFDEKGTSRMMTHMGGDVGGVVGGLNYLFGNSVREPLKMIACLVGAAVICWPLLLISLAIVPIAVLLMQSLSRSIRRIAHRSLDIAVKFNHLIYESFNGLQTVQSFRGQQHELERYRVMAKDAYRVNMKSVFYNSLVKPVTEVMGIGAVCTALIAGAYLVLEQRTHLFGFQMTDRPLSWGSLFVFYGFLIGMSDPARKLSDVFGGLQGGFAAADRFYGILDRSSAVADPHYPKSIDGDVKTLSFEQVSFGYTCEKLVLQDVNLELRRGEVVVVVGANGSGKSTLGHLISRFYDPCAGRVLINGTDLKELSLCDLRRRIAVVGQSAHLFDASVYDNIRYGKPDATFREIELAAKRAHADRFIKDDLSDGYETNVGPAGSFLSGGQRQRIALARAILCDPEIVLLDEATGQIDPHSEHLIHEALADFIKGRLTLMISHRLATLDLADQIVLMKEGQVADQGTHEQLMERCESYQLLQRSELKQTA